MGGTEQVGTRAESLAHESPFELGASAVDPSLLTLRNRNEEVRIEPRVMQVIVALTKAKDRLLSRDDLRQSCWGGRATSDDAVDRVIAQIRRLGAGVGGDSFTVETVPKMGYRLVESGSRPSSGAAAFAYPRRVVVGAAVAGAVGLAGFAALRPRLRSPARSTDRLVTVAVLPFRAELPSSQLSDFAAQLSDQIRSDISRVSGMRVIADTSSRKAAAEGGSAKQIAASLGADYLVEGDVGTSTDQVIATVGLVDSASGTRIWTAREGAPSSNPLGLRSAVVGDIIQQLAGIVPIPPRASVASKRSDPQVYALVQQANGLLQDGRTASMRGDRANMLDLGARAERLAQQALSIDPNDSGALAVLATITRNGWTPALARENLTTEQRVQRSIAIVKRALAADPRNPAALTGLGDYYRRFAFRWDEAENLFRRALATDPSFVDAHWSYGYELGTLGRSIEGLDHALSVFELDPRNPFHRVALPRLLYLLGQRPAAMVRYNRELEADRDNLFLLRELYFMFLAERNAASLNGLGARVLSTWSGRVRSAAVQDLQARIEAGRLALRGNPEPLRRLVDSEVATFDRPGAGSNATPEGRARDDLPFIFAIEYAVAGLPDRSLDMLDRALAAKSLYWPATLPYGTAQFPPEVRNSPRFAALWQRDPGLRQLVSRRRAAILSGQMAGFAPDGRKVVPVIPRPLVKRVQAALRARA